MTYGRSSSSSTRFCDGANELGVRLAGGGDMAAGGAMDQMEDVVYLEMMMVPREQECEKTRI